MPAQKTVFLIILFFSCVLNSVSSAEEEPWMILSRAQTALDKGVPGEAMSLCERAKLMHRQRVIGMKADLVSALDSAEVRKAGDSIAEVQIVLRERNETSALKAIEDSLRMSSGKQSLSSVSGLLKWLDRRVAYPEADFLTGRIYEAEGEISFALSYYAKVLDYSDMLYIPDERYTVLYEMSRLSELIGDYNGAEKYLLTILSEDELFTAGTGSGSFLSAMMRTLATETTMDKFFLLYRHDYYRGYEAYRRLSVQYFALGEKGERLTVVSSLAALIAVTRLSHACADADFQWSYSNISNLMKRVNELPEVRDWADRNDVWKMLYLYSEILLSGGFNTQAQYILEVLAENSPDYTVASAAKNLLMSAR